MLTFPDSKLDDRHMNVLPTDAAARMWDHIILDNDNVPGLPLKFWLKLLLSRRKQILKCLHEDLNEVLTKIPSRIQSSKDVDWLLETDLTTDPVQNSEVPTILKVPARPARLPKRWQPWNFLTVATVFPKPCLKGYIKFVGYCL